MYRAPSRSLPSIGAGITGYSAELRDPGWLDGDQYRRHEGKASLKHVPRALPSGAHPSARPALVGRDMVITSAGAFERYETD